MALNIGRLVGKARSYASQNPDKVSSGLDRAGDAVNRRTGGKHSSTVTKAKDALGKALGTSGHGGSRGGSAGAGPRDPR
ncbi:antitoxin [Pseudokineococcus marinus]|uniref:Antitoxin n=1 Tax=Pseudokineococcus marinus TaxID=351215 RepID=A0A849BM00_9ACTN|nr:antitoxin [Pseudokineococcus marinus]NNH24309.1 antitoxin [Pseudokineococcus marinus]